MKLRSWVLITLFILLIVNVGLIASIDNLILTFSYILSLLIIGNKIRKRLGVEI